MSKFWIFLSTVWQEAKKVTWPNKKELTTATIVVIIILAFVSVYLFLVDYGLINFFTKIVYPAFGIISKSPTSTP